MGQLELQQKLLTLAPKAWYQKPPANKMTYPCFVYKAVEPIVKRADNKAYLLMPRYEVLYISQEEDDGIWERMNEAFEYCDFGVKYISDQLHHYPFTINFR